MAYLEIKNLRKSFGCGPGKVEALDQVNFSVKAGEFVAFVGAPGSGKTTLVSLVAGLIMPDFGSITLSGKPVVGPGPDRGILAHSQTLLPWLSIIDNIAVAVETVLPSSTLMQRRRHAEKYVEMVGLSSNMHKKPRELSDGMRQRVSLARTLAMNPDVMLFDEPLGGLVSSSRHEMQALIGRIAAIERKTCLWMTDDVEEAVLLADRVIALTPGPRSTVSSEFTIDLPPRSRDRKLAQTARFHALCDTIETHLLTQREEKILRPLCPAEIRPAPPHAVFHAETAATEPAASENLAAPHMLDKASTMMLMHHP
ncbi:MAG: ABC transporter ATP-binding protein [Planctomycetia bacterium]|nr:ABC transporter ATP-binding protein [Planctomycetia bacterium]